MRNVLMAVLVAAVTAASPAFAGKHSSTGRIKTVHVKSYTTKGGKSVSSHKRSAPR